MIDGLPGLPASGSDASALDREREQAIEIGPENRAKVKHNRFADAAALTAAGILGEGVEAATLAEIIHWRCPSLSVQD
jgi:hypothetical protein